MDTMDPSEDNDGTRADVAMRRTCGRVPNHRAGARAVAASFGSAVLLFGPTTALAQRWNVDAGVSSEIGWTSNAAFGQLGSAAGSGETIDVRPYIAFRGEGGRLKFSGKASLDAVANSNRSRPNQLNPEADLRANLEAVQRFLFIDTSLRVLQNSADPFGASPVAGTVNANRVTTTQALFAPVIEHSVGDLQRYRLRSENSWTHDSGANAAAAGSDSAGYFGHHSLMFEHDPRPFGWRIEAERSETRYTGPAVLPLTDDLARLSFNYSVGPDFTVGVRGGRESTTYVTQQSRANIYGIDVKWQPSQHTVLTGFEEHRFFGSSWRVGFDHRTPQIALTFVSSRGVDTTPQSLAGLPATDNVAGLLDAMFTAQYPDPIARARVVQNFIAQQGLPTSTLQPVNLLVRRLSIATTSSATIALIGVRNTLSLTGFQARTEDLPDSALPASIGGTALTNNVQYGTSLAWTHRMTRLVSLLASAEWSRIRALEGFGDDLSAEKKVLLRLNVELTPKTTSFASVRYRSLNSNTATAGHEGAVFLGLNHRF